MLGDMIVQTGDSHAGAMRSRCCNGGAQARIARSNGELWLPTLDGVLRLDTAKVRRSSLSPPVVAESIEHLGVTWEGAGPFTLDGSSGDVTIQYAGLALQDPTGLRFRYRLLGYDETSHSARSRRTASDIGTLCLWKPGGGGTGQAGILKSFASTIFDFVSVTNGDKWTITDAFVHKEFAITPDSITPIGTTGVKAKAGQFGFPTNPNPNVSQSVAVLSFTWRAGDAGEAYDVLLRNQVDLGQGYLDVGLAVWVGENAFKVDDQGGFTVTPAPSAISRVVPLLWVVGNRRRMP